MGRDMLQRTLEELADLFDGQQPAQLALGDQAASEPAVEQRREHSILNSPSPLKIVPRSEQVSCLKESMIVPVRVAHL